MHTLLFMRTLLFVSAIAFALTLPLGFTALRGHYRISQDMSGLHLADDASTPQQKSEFLAQFMARMDARKLPTHGAWLMPTDRDSLESQAKVLTSLKRRCDDLAKVDPASLGYAQGMAQISGEEFDHALYSVAGVFETALAIEIGWLWLYGWLVTAAIGLVSGFLFAMTC